MTTAFEVASAVEAMVEGRDGRDGRFRANVPDGWQQGRGAFGGLAFALLLRAIERAEPDAARVTRTFSGDIAGPVLPGETEIVVTKVRRGSNQSNMRAELRQGADLVAFASAVLSTPRAQGVTLRPRITPPPMPDAGMDDARTPTFARHLEYRNLGPLPWSGGAEPVVLGYIRMREAPSVVDAPMLMALLDSYWPASFSMTHAPRPMATISFTAEIMCDPRSLDPKSPLFYRARTLSDHEGFQLELRELYDAAGDIVAMNQQTFAVLK